MQESLLADIGKSVLGAAALGVPAYFLRVPLLLAYLLAGVVLGPHIGFGLVTSAESISTLSEIGLILLMFILGLEINIKKLVHSGKAVLVCGVLQFLGCVALAIPFFKSTYLVDFGGRYGTQYLAVATALSSTLIVVKILSDRMELDTLVSRITLGVLVIQDMWAIIFLAIQPSITHMSFSAVGSSVAKAIILVVAAWLVAKYILPTIFRRVSLQPELMLIAAMSWCFFVCGIANYLHLSLEMGALVAGVSIASFPYHIDIAARVSSLRDFFITLFFVSLGLQIPQPTEHVVLLSIGIVSFVLISRLMTIFPILYYLGYGNRASILPAVNLSQLSEFAIVLGALGKSYGHISDELLSAFIISMVVTSLISSTSIPGGHAIYRFLNPWLERLGFKDNIGHTSQNENSTDGQGIPKIILLGFYRQASSLLKEMSLRHTEAVFKDLLVVDLNPEAHQKMKQMGVNCRYGDISHMDTLRGLELYRANIIICTIPDHQLKGITNVRLLKVLRSMAPKAIIIMTADTFSSAEELYRESADYVFIPRLVGAHYVADVLERIKSGEGTAMKSQAHEYVKGRQEILP